MQHGEYYPRMARPYGDDPDDSPGWNPEDREKHTGHTKTNLLAESEAQLHYLKEHLERVCQVVYPCEANHNAFGHEIRNVLILACTEVEGQWKGILSKNGITKDRYDTNDYVTALANNVAHLFVCFVKSTDPAPARLGGPGYSRFGQAKGPSISPPDFRREASGQSRKSLPFRLLRGLSGESPFRSGGRA